MEREVVVVAVIGCFQTRTVLGECMYAYITCRPDIGYAITTLSKFSCAPTAYHYKLLKGVVKYLRSTIDWGVRFRRTKRLEHPEFKSSKWYNKIGRAHV